MKNAEIQKTSDYIIPDIIEDRIIKDLNSHKIGSEAYQRIENKLFNKRMNNRGIHRTKQGYYLDGNAFAKYVSSKRLKAILIHGNLYIYNNITGRYDPVSETFLDKCMKEILEEFSDEVWSIANQNTYRKAFYLNLEHVIRPPINPDRLLLKNGILDLNEFCSGNMNALHPFSPDEIHILRIPHDYDPNASCDLFRQTISDIFNHDLQIINNFQEMLGYLLYYGGEWKIQKFYVLWGKGSNGKSLICAIIRKLLGENNCSSTPLDRLHETFALQDLYGKMVNIAPETEQKRLMDTAIIKAMCGGDAIRYEFKYNAPFTDLNNAKLIVCTNYPIKTSDTSRGFYRRLHVFPFDNQYIELKEGEKPKSNVKYMDTTLEAKLSSELTGILNFALEGLKRLKLNGWKLSKCKRIEEIQDKYYQEANEIDAFMNQCLSIRANCRAKSSEVYDKYTEWSLQVLNRNATYSRNDFHKKFREYLNNEGITWSRSEIHGIDYYSGIFIN